MKIIDDIKESLDNSKFSIGVFVDLEKAFDSVNHDTLLHKLNHYGVRGVANTLLQSYLSQRTKIVSVDGFSSEKGLFTLVYPKDLSSGLYFSLYT